jgi:hypothetical protein
VLAAAVAITLIATAITSPNGQNVTTLWLLALAGGTFLLRQAKSDVAFKGGGASRKNVPVLSGAGIYGCMDRP